MLPPVSVRAARVVAATLLALGGAGALATPAAATPMLEAPPTLSGVVAVGSTVTCVPGRWTGNGPLTKSYRWVIDGRDPEPYVASGPTYEPGPADEGWPLQCEERVTDADDTTAQNTQAQIVLPPQPLSNATPPNLAGTFQVGGTLTCNPGTWSRTATYAYAWIRDGVVDPAATTNTLALGPQDAGRGVACRVTATAAVGGQTSTATSTTAFIGAAPRVVEQPGKPTVTGDARIGSLLQCTPAAGSEEYQHEWKLSSGASLDPRQYDRSLLVPIAVGGQSLVCVASISNIDGYREARSDPVFIPALSRPTGVTDFPVFEQVPLTRYLSDLPTAQISRSGLAWRSTVTMLPPGDVRVNGIELTQATQYRLSDAFGGAGLPNRCNVDPAPPWVASICPPGEPVRYAGVKLVAGRDVTARVFVDRAGTRRSSPIHVRITIRTGTGSVIGGIVQTASLTTAVPADRPRLVADAQRRDAGSSVNVTIPGRYVREGTSTYEAEVVPDEEGCPTGNCTANNRFVLVGVPADETGILRIGTARVRYDPAPPTGNSVGPNDVTATTFDRDWLGGARAVLPVRAVEVRDLGTELVANTRACDVVFADPGQLGQLARRDPDFLASCRGIMGIGEVERFAAQTPGWLRAYRRYDTLVGLSQSKDYYARGWGTTLPGLGQVPFGYLGGPSIAFELKRPLRTIAHELVHNTGIDHAGRACKGAGPRAESWAPDDQGRLQGVGWDAGKVRYDGPADDPPLYDLMSYCGNTNNDDDVWVSPHNWDRMVDTFVRMDQRAKGSGTVAARRTQAGTRSGQRAQAGTLAPGDHLFVTALAGGGAARVERVEIGPARVVAGPTSGYVVRARAADGAVLAENEALAVQDGEGAGGPIAMVRAQLPPAAAGAARVEIVVKDGGALAGAKDRPAALAAIEATARPQPGRSGRVAVTWKAPEAATAAEIQVSIDDGKTWRLAWSGPASPGRVRLDGQQVPRAPRAKIRVRVTDGWNAQVDETSAFASVGAAPRLTLLAPAPANGRRSAGAAVTIQQGGSVGLLASAADDAGRTLRTAAITWLDGGRRIATGESATAARLTPGRHRFEVVARDRFGRTASRTFTVRVRAAAPTFTTLAVPSTAPVGARSVKVQVAATRAAELRVSGKRFAVGQRVKAITVPLPKGGRGEVAVTFELRADGKRSRVEAAVTRG